MFVFDGLFSEFKRSYRYQQEFQFMARISFSYKFAFFAPEFYGAISKYEKY